MFLKTNLVKLSRSHRKPISRVPSPEIEIWGLQKLHPFSWNFENADSEDDAKDKPHSTRFVMSVVSGHSLG